MKHIFLFLSALMITGCGMAENNHTSNPVSIPESSVDSVVNFNLPKEIIDLIKKHYHVEESELIKVEIVESTDYISLIQHEYLEGDSEPTVPPTEIGIPKTTNLIGDLNSDGNNDLIVPVSYNGGGSELVYDEIFIFISDGAKFILAGKPQSDGSSCKCEEGGIPGSCNFNKIANGYVEATSLCYSEEDATCCPSFEYAVKLKLENDKLVQKSKTLVRKIIYN